MPPLKSLSRNTLALLLSNTGSAVLSFALSVIIGRALGKEGLGVYAAALAWVFPLSLVAEFGIGTLMTREAARAPELEASYLRLSTQTRLWLGGSLTVLLFLLAPFLSDDAAVVQGLRLSTPLILITPLFSSITALFRARQQMWPVPWLNLGMLVAQVALTTLVFILGGDVLHALLVNTLTSAVQLAVAWWIWRRWFTPPAVAASSPTLLMRDMLRQAWPFALAGILAAMQFRLAPILLEKLSDTGNVGYYAAASRFVEAGRTIPNALFGALFPLLAVLVSQPDKMRQTFRKVMLGLAAFSGLLAIVFTLFSPLILNRTYGADFTAAAATLQISMWALVPSLLRAGLTLYWYAQSREQLTNQVIAMMLVVQLALSLWLIPTYGAYGAAWGVLGSELLGVVLLMLPFRQR
ncbi:MAG: flippase [Chloroflexi bacterium]|nr:flippase [Chloroflexota bacterium]MCC6891861.1 flippase [Anaerolineae bacterium]